MLCSQISARTRLYYEPRDRDLALFMAETCARSGALIKELWELEEPRRCRVYIMTSALSFYFHSTPVTARIVLGLALPLWYWRVRKVWRYCGGWTWPYRGRPAVGVKPPRLIEQADRSIGELVYEPEPDLRRKMEHIACHELTHAYAGQLQLPMWLNEGLAMVTVDKYFGRQTVKSTTLAALAQSRRPHRPAQYRRVPGMSKEEIAYHYTWGYWAVRYLTETHPELLREILRAKRSRRAVEKLIAGTLGCDRGSLWSTIDDAVAMRFGTV